MGRGDNRRTPKMRQRKNQRRKKTRLKKQMSEAKVNKKKKPSSSTRTVADLGAGQAAAPKADQE